MATKKLKSYRFDEKTILLIEELKEQLELDNNSAVLRRAITLLKFTSEFQDNGGKIIFRDRDGDREIIR